MLQQIRSGVEVSPPLYFVLAWLTSNLGNSPELLRLPSLVIGVGLVPLTFYFGSLTFSRTVGLLGAAFIALSPFEIFYSTEARPYATLAFLSVLSLVFLVRACESGRDWSMWWLATACASALAMYTHYTGVFVLAAGFAWAAVSCRGRITQVAFSAALGVALYLPWFLQVSTKGQLAVYGPFQPLDDLRTDVLRTIVGSPFVPIEAVPGTAAVAALLLLAAAGTFCYARGRVGSDAKAPGTVTLVLVTALATPVGMMALSALTEFNLFSPRNLSASVPSVYIGMAALVLAIKLGTRWLVPTIAIAIFSVGTVKALSGANMRPDFEALASLVDRSWEPGSQVVTIGPNDATSNRPLDPYLRGNKRPVFGSPRNYQQAFVKASEAGGRVFVVYPNQTGIRELVVPPKVAPGMKPFQAFRTFAKPGIAGGVALTVFVPAPASRQDEN